MAGRSTQDAALPEVPGAEALGDDALAPVALLVQHGFVQLGVERLAFGDHRLEALLGEGLEQHLGDGPDIGGVVQDGGIAGVEHRQDLHHEGRRGPLTGLAGFLGGALAVVVELGLHPLEGVAVLVALDLGRAGRDIDEVGIGTVDEHGLLDGGEGVVDGRLGGVDGKPLLGTSRRAALGGIGHDQPASSSSTISASTTSSSLGVELAPPVAPAEPPAASASAACW